MNRVRILTAVVVGSLAAALGGAICRMSAAEESPAKTAPSAGQALLTPDDFTFVGSYPFSADRQGTFGMGLTHHRVKGELRFLTFSYEGAVKARLIEFALPADVGQKIAKLTNHWDDIWSPAPIPTSAVEMNMGCGGRTRAMARAGFGRRTAPIIPEIRNRAGRTPARTTRLPSRFAPSTPTERSLT